MTDPYIEKILNADVYDVAAQTPLTQAPTLSERMGCDVRLKREDLQPIFSFKCRGAYNKMASLSDEERARGVVAASAGNHAQGVALAAQKLGVQATIVMPVTTPSIKVEAVGDAELTLFSKAMHSIRRPNLPIAWSRSEAPPICTLLTIPP